MGVGAEGGAAVSGLVWWANRKSRMGLNPAAKPAPHLPDGREWWCEPPVALPEPAHIEYATKFMAEMLGMHPRTRAERRSLDEMKARVAHWLRVAKRLCHERMEAKVAGLETTDDLIVAGARSLSLLVGLVIDLGGRDRIFPEILAAKNALVGKSHEIQLRRAMDPGHAVKRVGDDAVDEATRRAKEARIGARLRKKAAS